MSPKVLNIVSVLPVLGQPRHSKRISMLQQAGFDVEAVAFEREYHSGRMPDCPTESLGRVAHGRYLQRILRMIRAFPKMRRALKRNDIAYAFGIDMALMTLIAGTRLGKPVVIEIGDIRKIQVASGLKGRLVRMLDEYITNQCSLLVATAPGYIDTYYRKWLKASVPAMVIENKVEQDFVEDVSIFEDSSRSLSRRPLIDRPLCIGYFGLLRCDWSWQVLETLASARPHDFEILVAGYPIEPTNLPECCEKLSNAEYIGEYTSPDDLPCLYGRVDLVWGCYPYPCPGDWNWRWARTNRYYESCLFQKPIISLAESGDASEVDRYGIGMNIPRQSIAEVVELLSNITVDDLKKWKENLSRLPHEAYVYTYEAEDLKKALEAT